MMEKNYSEMYIEPVPSFFREFLVFLRKNFLTMVLETYQSFVISLYEKHHKGDQIDFVLADIYHSCVRISQLNPEYRNDKSILAGNDGLSIGQKVWLDEVLKEMKL